LSYVTAVAFKRTVRAVPTLDRMPNHLHLLATHLAWANRQLFGALREVDGFSQKPGADLIIRALDHIQVVSRIFQAHLGEVAHGYTSTQSASPPSLVELDRGSVAIDDWYVAAAASMPADELARPRDVRFTDGKVVTMTAATMILHVITHTLHHRGNVDAIMFQTGMPRRRDGFPEFLVSRASAR
jgi:uncharacterized damage-inducible protein DinB